jgi:superfamily II DNA or RNA helicase
LQIHFFETMHITEVIESQVKTTETKKLYPFQQKAVDDIFSKLLQLPPNANLLFQLPTGGGKTIIFSEIAFRYIRQFQKKVLILTHRIELSKQTSDVLKEKGIKNLLINSAIKSLPKEDEYESYTALVETLNNRLQESSEFLSGIGLVIVDEAHYNSFRKIFHHFEDINILGVTATPLSSNKKLPLRDTYSDIIIGESISNLISSGYLCEATTFSYDVNLSTLKIGSTGEFTVGSSELLYSSAMMQSKLIDAYEEVGLGTKTLIFNSGILSSRAVCEMFKKKNYPVRHLDSTFTDKERADVLDWFRNTPNGILTSVSILTTGFDEPAVETIMLNRATKSLTLYHQMIGRGSRILPQKKSFKIIDLGNNARRFGLWQLPVDWKHVFIAPQLYLENRYKDEWDFEMENDYEMPEEIKQRFLSSSMEAFVVRDRYLKCVRNGVKPQQVLEESNEDHFLRIRENSSNLEEAFELFHLLDEEKKYRIRQFCKCINATENYADWQIQTYNSKLRRKIISWFAVLADD